LEIFTLEFRSAGFNSIKQLYAAREFAAYPRISRTGVIKNESVRQRIGDSGGSFLRESRTREFPVIVRTSRCNGAVDAQKSTEQYRSSRREALKIIALRVHVDRNLYLPAVNGFGIGTMKYGEKR